VQEMTGNGKGSRGSGRGGKSRRIEAFASDLVLEPPLFITFLVPPVLCHSDVL